MTPEIEKAINKFKANQTLTNLGVLQNLNLRLKILRNNKWEELKIYHFPYENIIPIYEKVNGTFNIASVGVY